MRLADRGDALRELQAEPGGGRSVKIKTLEAPKVVKIRMTFATLEGLFSAVSKSISQVNARWKALN